MEQTGAPVPSTYLHQIVAVILSAALVAGGTNLAAADPGEVPAKQSPGTWTSIPTTEAPVPRVGHTAVWTEIEMLVWDG